MEVSATMLWRKPEVFGTLEATGFPSYSKPRDRGAADLAPAAEIAETVQIIPKNLAVA